GLGSQVHPARGAPRAERADAGQVPLRQRLSLHLPFALPGRAGRTRNSRAGPAEAAARQWQAASRPGLAKDTGHLLLARQLVKKYFTPRPAAGTVAGDAPEALHPPGRTPATRSAASLRPTPRPGRRAPAARLR